MKKIILILGIAILSTFILSCKKESANVSKITYYPDFVFSGADLMLVKLDSTYIEPGVTASANGQPLTIETVVTGRYTGYSGTTVDTHTPDQYLITYRAKNSDGFYGSVTRTVFVTNIGNLVNSIEGLYDCTVSRVSPAGSYSNIFIMIWKTGANTYEISDALGGFYADGRSYGDNYKAGGCIITATDIPSNTFTFGPALVPAWGDDAQMNSMTVNPGTKTITATTAYVTYTFNLTLTQLSTL
jgi:hypothetical protein